MMHKIFSRKEFLNQVLLQGVRALTPWNSTENSKSSQNSEFLALTELSPSLLKIEAERLGIDPNEGDTEDLRKKIYKALSENCLQRSDQ
ncbi:MAG TPA: hypothetical protein ENN23_07210 [Deltaproteobacteria bacterium]|nr:hypothetical protein [Deltaproteobacteria bacterium]